MDSRQCCILFIFSIIAVYVVAQLVEALRYKVACSISDYVIGIFHNPSGRTMALESTQPLTETSTRNISWGVKESGA